MPISYKHKIYTTLGTPTALSGNVVSATDNAGVPAKDYTIKGRTIVWNQLIQNGNFVDETGWGTYNGTGSVSNNKYTLTAAGIDTYSHIVQYMDKSLFIVGHKYYITATITPQYSAGEVAVALHNGATIQVVLWAATASSGKTNFVSTTFTIPSNFVSGATDKTRLILYCPRTKSAQGDITEISNVWMVDLTEIFGSGNEPTTVAEFRAMFPDDYYPYNAGELKSIVPEAVETKNQSGETKRVNIPSSKYFPDGMRSTGSVYDEINFLSQKAIKRIGVVDLGTLNWTYDTTTKKFIITQPLADMASATYSYSPLKKTLCQKYIEKGFANFETDDTQVGYSTHQKFIYIRDIAYTDAAAFKSAMSGVMLYYELATPVETPITPPLQALQTFKGFTSFSAPNSLTQNGPLSVTYYAEGGESPEKGWLTSYKRKLYMGRSIEWNQLLGRTNRARVTNNGVTAELKDDGSYVVNGTATDGVLLQLETSNFSTVTGHKYFVTGCPKNGSMKTFRMYDGWSGQYTDFGDGVIFVASVGKVTLNFIAVTSGYTCTNLIYKPQMFDLTQMFGAGNEPATPEEFWSYFDHKLYPYNTGETQPLFKISRKSYIYKEPAGYTVHFREDIWIASTVTISVEYADGSTATLTSQSDVGGKSYSNIVKMTFTDTDSERYVVYQMPANGGSEETLYLRPTATLVLTADAKIWEIGR